MFNRRFPVLLAGMFLTVASLSAQNPWMGTFAGRSLALEILKPSFEGGDAISFATSAIYLSGRFRLSAGLYFVGESCPSPILVSMLMG